MSIGFNNDLFSTFCQVPGMLSKGEWFFLEKESWHVLCGLTDDEEESNNRMLKINNPILSGCFRVEITMRIAIQYCNDH